MSMALMAQAMSIKVGNPLRKLVLIKLADNANDKGECWPSHRHIADHCECSKTAVRNHIDALEEMGLLERENRLGVNNGKGNTSNLYFLKLTANPMPLKSTGVCNEFAPPMPPDGTPPMPPDGTRTSHSSESVNESKESGAQEEKGAGFISEEAKRRLGLSVAGGAFPLPPKFTPNAHHQMQAREYGLNLENEFGKFADHHASRGTTMVDWARGFSKWLRDARDMQPQKSRYQSTASAITVSKTGYVFFDR